MKPSLKIKRPVVFSQPPESDRTQLSVEDTLVVRMKKQDAARPIDERKVMGRLEWFRDLKNVFLKIQEESPETPAVSKSSLLQGFLAYRFDLQDSQAHYEREKSVAFSYEEVLSALTALSDARVSWDQVIDAIFQIGVTRAKQQSKAADDSTAALASSQSASLISTHSSAQKLPPSRPTAAYQIAPKASLANTVDISFPDERLPVLPRELLEERWDALLVISNQYLTLAGNALTDCKVPLPPGLVILNLSFNQLTEFEVVSALPNLRLLNLGNNQIRRLAMLQKCKGTQEVYLSHNRLTTVGALCHLDRLSLLDLSHNAIAAFEDLASLTINARLIGLRVKGNPVSSRAGYLQTVKALLPKVQHLDEPSLRPMSDFETFGSLAFVVARVETVLRSALPSETASEVSSHRSDSQKRGPRANKPPKFNRYLHTATPPHRGTQRSGFRPSQSTKSTPLSRRTPNGSIGDFKELQMTQRSEEPEALPHFVVTPQRSQTALNKLPLKRTPEPPPAIRDVTVSQHSRSNQSFEQALSFLSEAEKRLDEDRPVAVEPPPQRKVETKDHSISLITAETIQNAHEKRYGNPVAALMIGPPATPQKVRNGSTKRKEATIQKEAMTLSMHRSVPKVRVTKSPISARDPVVQVDLARRYR